ncbi:MAG: TolC family protein [Planctomycetota bacterium]
MIQNTREPHRLSPLAGTLSRSTGVGRVRPCLLFASTLLSSCATYVAEPLDSAKVLEQLVQRPVRAWVTAGVDSHDPWRQEWFPLEGEIQCDDGITLAEANALALAYSPALRIARARGGMATALVVQAGLLSNPQLTLGPRLSVEDGSTIFPAGLSWRLPLWGQRPAREERALASLDAQELSLVEAEVATLQSVRGIFLRLERSDLELNTLRSAAAFNEELVRWVQELSDAGQADPASVFLIRVERDRMRGQLETAQGRRALAKSELLELLGMLPGAPVQFKTSGARVMPQDDEVVEEDWLLRAPSVRLAKARYVEAEASLKLAVRQQYPGVRLGLEYEDDRGEVFLGPGVFLSLPLFDRNQGRIEEARRARQLAREEYTLRLLQASHRAARFRARRRQAAVTLDVYRKGALREADEASVALQARLRIGRVTPLEAATTQATLTQSRVRLLELEEQLYRARFDFAVASGTALAPLSGSQDGAAMGPSENLQAEEPLP